MRGRNEDKKKKKKRKNTRRCALSQDVYDSAILKIIDCYGKKKYLDTSECTTFISVVPRCLWNAFTNVIK